MELPDTSPSSQELENASDYLSRHHFKTLVEWLTAEVILNRPRDPLVFLRDAICDKIELRGPGGYNPADCVDYAKQCYQEAAETADEAGQIHPRKLPRKPSTLNDSVVMKKRLATLEQALTSCGVIAGQLDPWDATEAIVSETCKLLNCDRATLFTVDGAANELQVMVSKGAEEIRLPMGQGVAGTVAVTGSTCNIPNAYEDARFSSEHDVASGYKTRNILAAPVIEKNGNTVGVIQAINRFSKKDDASLGLDVYEKEDQKDEDDTETHIPFTPVDEEMIAILAAQASIALNNANLYQTMSASQAKVQSLLDIIQAMHSNLGINSLMFTITQRAHELVEADRCTMFLLDKAAKELMSLQGEVNLRIPMDKGIAGECCTTNKVINIPEAYEDSRFNQDVDKRSGYRTHTILCMPCQDSDGNVVGVIQLINKRKGTFTLEDEQIMEAFLVIAGPVLAQSQLFQQRTNSSDGGDEFNGKGVINHSANIAHENTIQEGDEDDEDEEE